MAIELGPSMPFWPRRDIIWVKVFLLHDKVEIYAIVTHIDQRENLKSDQQKIHHGFQNEGWNRDTIV